MQKQQLMFNKLPTFFQVQCFPLYSLLLAVGNPVVDFLSLDTEGTELDVSLADCQRRQRNGRTIISSTQVRGFERHDVDRIPDNQNSHIPLFILHIT